MFWTIKPSAPWVREVAVFEVDGIQQAHRQQDFFLDKGIVFVGFQLNENITLGLGIGVGFIDRDPDWVGFFSIHFDGWNDVAAHGLGNQQDLPSGLGGHGTVDDLGG